MGLRHDDIDELPSSGCCIYVDDLRIGQRLDHRFDIGALESGERQKAEDEGVRVGFTDDLAMVRYVRRNRSDENMSS
jgi:hypothetical protein